MAVEDAPARRNVLGRSQIFTSEVINDIHVKAELGRYRMRGFSMFKPIPHWDELMFLPGTLTRFVIEGYREKCETKTVLGARFAKNPLELDIPIYINFTNGSYGNIPLLFGAAFQYNINDSMSIGGSLKLGPSIYASGQFGGCGGLAFGGCAVYSPLGLIANAFFGYRL